MIRIKRETQVVDTEAFESIESYGGREKFKLLLYYIA